MNAIKNLLLGLFLLVFIGTTNVFSQEEKEAENQEQFQPVFITMTTAHWSADPDVDFSDWLETEKEYFEKVTKKNDLIIGSGFYTHYFTPDNSEIVMVSVYKTWEDIEKANEVNQKLIEEAWTDEDARKAFFDKQGKYYSPMHNDEIYSSMSFHKPLDNVSDEPRIYYVKTSELAMDGEGTAENFREYTDKVTMKNTHLKGYYTHRHRWGANSREFVEVFVFDSLSDLEKSFEEDDKRISETWTDEKERENFMKEMGKLFTGKHGDYIYRNVPELMK